MNTSEILNKAADLIREKGWQQGNGGKGPDGEICAWRAITQAAAESTDNAFHTGANTIRARQALTKAAGCGISVPAWNDDPSTTEEDVLLAFKHAAHNAEQAGE